MLITVFIWPQKNTLLFEANLKGNSDCPVLMSCALLSLDFTLPVGFEVCFYVVFHVTDRSFLTVQVLEPNPAELH